MSIRGRLRRLEGRGRLVLCECRHEPQRIHAVYPGEDAPEPERCPRCGRLLSFVVRVVYEGDEERSG
ncbi:MAG: hypothetical protein M3Q60_21805 [Actinomycetota bacterium]|nr:hypothetical protein [Actinomycetota bacterium]